MNEIAKLRWGRLNLEVKCEICCYRRGRKGSHDDCGKFVSVEAAKAFEA